MTSIIIALILFLGSFAGLIYMIGKKLPLILALPIKEKEGLIEFKVPKFVSSPELFLQKLVSKARIFSLRAEAKTSDWLVKLRKKSQEKNGKFSSSYWDKFKKKK
jgi:hypothetical protein